MLLLTVQTFDFDKPGELTMLERHACESYFNQQQPDKVSYALIMHIRHFTSSAALHLPLTPPS